MKPRLGLLLLITLVAAVFASGCVQAASPRGWAQPVQYGDLLLITAGKGKLDAIDPQTGDRKWRFPDDWSVWDKQAQRLSGIYGQPQVDDDTIYVGDYNGYVYAFRPADASTDKATRKPVGLFKLHGSIVGGMYLDQASKTLYVTTDEGRLYALNARNLAERTSADKTLTVRFPSFDAGDRIWTPPVLSSGRVYFATTGGQLFALDARDASVAWAFKADAALVATPVVAGDTVLAGGFDRRLYAVDAGAGREKWSFEATDWIWTKPIVDGDRVYFADFAGKVFAVSLSDGRALWGEPADVNTSVRAGLVLSAGSLVVANDAGELYGIDPATGRLSWGPVKIGTSVHADLLSKDTTVYVAPTRCTTEETTGKVYYYKVNTATRERQSTASVC